MLSLLLDGGALRREAASIRPEYHLHNLTVHGSLCSIGQPVQQGFYNAGKAQLLAAAVNFRNGQPLGKHGQKAVSGFPENIQLQLSMPLSNGNTHLERIPI